MGCTHARVIGERFAKGEKNGLDFVLKTDRTCHNVSHYVCVLFDNHSFFKSSTCNSFSTNKLLLYQCKQMLLHISVEPRGRGFAKGGCCVTW